MIKDKLLILEDFILIQ